MKIGVIGVGTMGYNIVKALLEAKHEVFASDIDSEKVKKTIDLGAKRVESPKGSAEGTDISLLSLPTPADVELVVCSKDGILSGAKPGHIIVDTSTIDPFSTRQNAERAKASGVGYLDAPVLGRPQACGRWTLPVGGGEADFEKARQVLEVLAAKIIHLGPSGSGNIVKLLNNMMFGAINMITVEIFARDFSPVFSVNLLHKDMALGIEMARRVGMPIFVAPAAQILNEIAKSKGFGGEDTAAAIKVYEEILGLRVEAVK